MKIPSNKIKDIRLYMKALLGEIYDIKTIDRFAEIILEYFAEISRTDMYLFPEKTVSESVLLKINNAIKKLKEEVPIEHIVGFTHFYGLKINVNSKVLIPRPETEELIQLILKTVNNEQKEYTILDACTGSGCIAIALKKHIQKIKMYAFDICPEALEIAKNNAINNNCQINFFQHDLLNISNFDTLPMVDILVCNPPYVRKSEKERMQKNVINYEPHLALFVEDKNPLIFYKALAQLGKAIINKDGLILCEINEALGKKTSDVFKKYYFKDVKIIKDLNGKERFVVGKNSI